MGYIYINLLLGTHKNTEKIYKKYILISISIANHPASAQPTPRAVARAWLLLLRCQGSQRLGRRQGCRDLRVAGRRGRRRPHGALEFRILVVLIIQRLGDQSTQLLGFC